MTFALALVLGWCLLSVGFAFGLGPLLHKAAVLAEARETPPPAQFGRTAA